MQLPKVIIFLYFYLILNVFSCSYAPLQTLNSRGIASSLGEIEVILDEKLELPLSASTEIKKSFKVLMSRLKRQSDGKLKLIVTADDQVNASIDLITKKITISSGLIKLADSIDELAGVLAHELGHLTQNNNFDNHERAFRSQFNELRIADRDGLVRMLAAGYDPREFETIMKKVLAGNNAQGIIKEFYSTHPNSNVRMSAIIFWLQDNERKASFSKKKILAPSFSIFKDFKANNLIEFGGNFNYKKQDISLKKLYQKLIENKKFLSLDENEKIKIIRNMAVYESARVDLVRLLYLKDLSVSFSQIKTSYSYNISDKNEELLKKIKDISGVNLLSVDNSQILDLFKQVSRLDIDKKIFIKMMSLIRSFVAGITHEDMVSVQNDIFKKVPTGNLKSLEKLIGEFANEQILKELMIQLKKGLLRSEEKTLFSILFRLSKDLSLSHMFEYDEFKEAFLQIHSDYYLGDIGHLMSEDFYYKLYSSLAQTREGIKTSGIVKEALRDLGEEIGYKSKATKAQKYYFFKRTGVFERHQVVDYLKEEISDWKKLVSFGDTVTNNKFPKINKIEFKFDAYDGHKYLLETLNNKISGQELIKIANSDYFWPKVDDLSFYSGNLSSLFGVSNYDSSELEKQYEKIFPKSSREEIKNMSKKYSSPAYRYNLLKSQQMQEKLLSLYSLPKNSNKQFEVYSNLAKRGSTDFTDSLLFELLDNKSFKCIKCFKKVLEENLLWDMSKREKILDKYIKLTNLYDINSNKNRDEQIRAMLKVLDSYFPEESLERLNVFEKYSNMIKASYEETKLISQISSLRTENTEALAIKTFSAIMGSFRENDDKWGFIQFLISGESDYLNDGLLNNIENKIGTKRLLDKFRNLTPSLKAFVINSFLVEPNGLLADDKYSKIIDNFIVNKLPKHKKQTQLFLNAMKYSLDQNSSYLKSLSLSLILSQTSNVKSSPGHILKIFLESFGSIGISAGQKMISRRLLPVDLLKEIVSVQEQTMIPTRLEVFDMVIDVLGEPDIDKVLNLDELLGAASAKVVLKVQYKNGQIKEKDYLAMKMLRSNYEQNLKQDSLRIYSFIDYLIKHGGAEYKKFKPLVKNIISSLYKQSDLSKDSRYYNDINKIFEGKTRGDNVSFKVIKQDVETGIKPEYSHEYLADGKSLRSLDAHPLDKKYIYKAVGSKLLDILLEGPNENGEILYEGDRHPGNFKYKKETTGFLIKNTTYEIQVFDYTLLKTIKKEERSSVLKLLGLTELLVKNGPNVDFVTLISEILNENIIIGKKIKSREAFEIINILFSDQKYNSNTDLLLDIMSKLQTRGFVLNERSYEFLEALGHAEFYSSVDKKFFRKHFLERVTSKIEDELLPYKSIFIKNKIKSGCKLILSKLFD